MNGILDLVQSTLDNLLSASGIRVYWGRRTEIAGDKGDAEYVIYTISSDSAEVSADGDLYYRTAQVALQYYVKYTVGRTYAGRLASTERMNAIMQAMRAVGFGCPTGWVEIGDVDQIGYATFRSEYEIPHYTKED